MKNNEMSKATEKTPYRKKHHRQTGRGQSGDVIACTSMGPLALDHHLAQDAATLALYLEHIEALSQAVHG